MEFVKNRYFKKIETHLRDFHFVPIEKISISSSECAYRVPSPAGARATSLFFSHTSKALIIQAVLCESNCFSQPEYHWNFKIYGKLLPSSAIITTGGGKDLHLLPGLNRDGSKEGVFKIKTWLQPKGDFKIRCMQFDVMECPLNQYQTVYSVMSVIDPLLPFLGMYFHGFDVSGFPPTYFFPKCRGLFWFKFREGILRTSISNYGIFERAIPKK